MTEHPLIPFLRARYDEREQAALAAKPGVNPLRGEWSFVDMQVRDDAGHLVVKHTWPNEGEHIALNDPAYVLADIASKRAILDEHLPVVGHDGDVECWTCVHVGDDEDAGGNRFRYRERSAWPCVTVLSLAEPYVSHPDYPKDV